MVIGFILALLLLGITTPALAVTPQIAAGGTHTVALKTDGTVWAWGDDNFGQLGNGTTTINATPAPVQVAGLTGVTAIAAGSSHTVALKTDGTVWAWGDNIRGQLGNGYGTSTNSAIPVQVAGLTGVTAIAAGSSHTMALKTDGTVWAWGYNIKGQLGNGTTTDSTAPVQVAGLTGVTAIAAGGSHTVALKTGGTVWAWGDDIRGQLGNGTTTDSVAPVQVAGFTGVTAIATGGSHTVALKTDGTAWAWGYNNVGQLGNGTTTNSAAPVQVAGLTGVTAIAAGGSHTVALMNDGTVWAWGYGNFGQLGNGTTTDSTAPVQVAGLTGVTAIAAGSSHTVALKTDGTVWAWGYDNYGQLGNGTTTDSAIPVQVAGLTGVTAIAAGGYHTVALKNDSTVWAWGYNGHGQLGNGTTTINATPAPVQVAGLTGVTTIAAGGYHTVALKNDGTVWAWGYGNFGQLGNGTTTDGAIPVQVAGLTGVTAIAAGGYHTVALKTDGTVWAWGYNGHGQLGNGTTTTINATPVQVAGLTGVTTIVAGNYHTAALKIDGTVWAWGDNIYGQLGHNPGWLTVQSLINLGVLNVTPTPGSGGNIDPATPQTVNYDGTTNFTVTPNAGYVIASVTGCGGSLSGGIYTTGPLKADCTVAASFVQLTYPLTITFAGAGSGTIAATTTGTLGSISFTTNGSTSITSGAVATLTSSAATNSTFGGWIGCDSAAGTICTVTMSAAKGVTSTFTISKNSITFAAGVEGSLSGSTSQAIDYGGSASAVTAVPAAGYHFVNWTEGTTVVGTAAVLTISNVTIAHSYTANFAADPINGACGLSNGGTFAVAPTIDFCTPGTASAVTGSGPWSWNCSGSNGGSTINCFAAIDITGPTLTVSTLAAGAVTNNATLNISGTVSDTSGVNSLKVNNANVTVTSGSFSYAVTLQAGVNTITTIATDTLGNQTTDTRTITLDQSAPVLTVTAPADNSKTAQPLATVTGTISETSTVTITVNSGTPQSASITGSAYSASITLASGLNSITITATDLAGNTASAVRTVTFDNSNPSLAITSPNQDITVNQNSLTISGTVSDTITSAIVTVTFNNQTYTPAITNGTFAQQLTIPAEGTFTITATATDESGNSSSVTRNVIYVMPVNGVCGSSNGEPQGTAPTISLCTTGTASAVTGSGPWSWNCSGSNGGSTINCFAAIDITGPTLTVSTLAAGAVTNNATLNISGTVSDTSGVNSLKVNNANVTVTSGSFSYAVTLQAGVNTITAIATDTLGNQTTDTRTITLDQSAPVLTVTAPADNSKTAQPLATVTGTISETSTVTITVNSGTPQSASITGSAYSASITLASGLNNITITATDLAGNTTSAVRTVTFDNSNPSLAITSPNQDITVNQNNLTISGTVSDTITSAIVTVTFNNQTYTPAITNGTFAQQLTIPAEGTFTITATATDEAGNSSSVTRNVIYVMPVNGVCGSSNGETQGTAPTISLCTTGTATAITGSGPWNWTCTGNNSGTNATCSTNIQSYPITFTSGGNGTLTGTVNQTVILYGSASAVTAVPAAGYDFVNWTEGTTVVGTAAVLTIRNVTIAHSYTANFAADPVNGACGLSNGGTFTIAPTINFCTTGTASAVTGSDPWSWNCSGSNGGSTTNCFAAIDITGPTLTVSTLAVGAVTNNATLNISGTVSDTSGVNSLKVNNTNVTVTSGSFSYAVTLQAGVNTITTIATDTLGNQTSDARTITLDQSAPVLTVTAPADNSKTAQPLATVTGTISETSTVTITVNSGTPQSASITGSAYSASITLASGLNSITITATDLAGNTTSAVRTVTFDNTNPSLAITDPNQDITTALSSITISGTVSDAITSTTVSISFNGRTLTPSVTSETFSQLLAFPSEGTWLVVVTAVDEVGNTVTATRNVIHALPANGSCGTSNNAILTIAPTNYLCNSGTATTVTGTGPWSWTCSGINGGITATCAANIATSSTTQYTVTPTTGSGFTITPAAPQVINNNVATSFNVTPASGYGIASVSGCGGSLSGYTYTTGAITTNCTVSVTAVARNATSGSGSTSPPTITDALKVLQAVVGITSLTASEQIHYDVAPLLASGIPLGNGVIDAADVIAILRRSIGIGSW